MSEKICPMMSRMGSDLNGDIYKADDKYIPCQREKCQLWVDGKPRNFEGKELIGERYTDESHCGLISAKE